MPEKIAFVTGVSSGLGRAFAKELLDNGYTVVGTVRNAEAAAAFEGLSYRTALGRILELTDYHAIGRMVKGLNRASGRSTS